MAESLRKSCSRSCSQKKLEFLRVLIPNPFAKLRIPGRIANIIQNEPHQRATLHDQHGKFWHVGIRREDDDLYLDEGWKEFAEALHLRTGYFVLFQYKVNMVFSVKIYDNTMCLKEYAPDSSKRSIHDLYEDTVKKVGMPSTKDNRCYSIHSSRKRQKLKTSHIFNRENVTEKIDGRIDKEIVKASPFAPYIPRFIRTIKPTHLTSECLGIPKDFCMRHGLVSERELFLVSTNGKSWPVQFSLTHADGKLSGFRGFARNNGLREGDRCTFKLVKKNTLLVRVMASGAETQPYSPIYVQNNNNLKEVPEFERVVTRCYLHNMYIPNGVRKITGLVSDCDVVLMNQEGRSWPAEFFIKSNGEGHIAFGWGKFLRANNIKEGNRCNFKLVEKNVLLVNVVDNESTDTLCKEMHTPTQVPNKKIVSVNNYLINKAAIEVRVNNANVSLTSSVVEVPSITALEKIYDTVSYSNLVAIEKVPSIEALEEVQMNFSPVNVDKALEDGGCTSSTSDGQNTNCAQKDMISLCIEKAPCIEAQEQMVWRTTNVLSPTGIERIPVNEQDKSSSVYVEKTPSSEAQKEKVQNNNSSTGTEAPELQKKLIAVCVEKTPCVIAQKDVGENNTNSLSLIGVDNTPKVEQKNSVHVQKPPSTEKKVEKRKKDWSSPSVQKRPFIEVQKVQQEMGDWSSTRFPKIEKVVGRYNVHQNYMVLSKEFCTKADLCSHRHLILKDSLGKTWRVNYSPNNGRGRLRWDKFVNDKKIKIGDKCIFKLITHDTLLVNVVRK